MYSKLGLTKVFWSLKRATKPGESRYFGCVLGFWIKIYLWDIPGNWKFRSCYGVGFVDLVGEPQFCRMLEVVPEILELS